MEGHPAPHLEAEHGSACTIARCGQQLRPEALLCTKNCRPDATHQVNATTEADPACVVQIVMVEATHRRWGGEGMGRRAATTVITDGLLQQRRLAWRGDVRFLGGLHNPPDEWY